MGRNIQRYHKIKYPKTHKNILLLDGKPRSSEVKELQYPLLLLQITFNTTVDLGTTNLVPRYTGELLSLSLWTTNTLKITNTSHALKLLEIPWAVTDNLLNTTINTGSITDHLRTKYLND